MYLTLRDRKAINNGYTGAVGSILQQEHDLHSQLQFINNRNPELQQQSTTGDVGSLPQNGAVHVTGNNGSLVWNPSLYEQLGKFGAQELNPQNQDLNDKGKSGGNLTLAGIGAGLAVADNIDTGDPRGLWDTMDPVYHLAGDKESKVGNGLSDAGVALTKTGLLSGNFYLAAAGGAVKVLGGLTNALFGTSASAERERKLRKAAFENLQKKEVNSQLQLDAMLKNKYDKQYGYLNNLSLFKFSTGKESITPIYDSTKEIKRPRNTVTSHGIEEHVPNSVLLGREVARNKYTDDYVIVPGDPKKGDVVPGYIKDNDVVYSRKYKNPETGNIIADDAPAYIEAGQGDRLELILHFEKTFEHMKTKQNKNIRKYALGKEMLGALSKAFDGNMVTLGSAMANAREQYRDSLEPIYRPDVYEANRYEMPALKTLNSLRLDYYPVARLNLEAEARSRNNIARSGGLSAGQKAMLYRTLNYDTQRNNANTLFNNMLQNNAYKQAAAQAAIQLGQDEAKGRLQANMFTEEALAKAHAAAIQQKNMSMFNAQNALEQFYANRFKKYQYDRAMNLYEQQRADDERQREYERNKNSKKSIQTNRSLLDQARAYLNPRHYGPVPSYAYNPEQLSQMIQQANLAQYSR